MASVRKTAQALNLEKKCEFLCGDAVELMKKMTPKSFAAIALDPPAFITNKKNVVNGLKAYLQNNAVAAKLVMEGGILSTSSCSHHCEEQRFEEAVQTLTPETARCACQRHAT